MRVALFGGSFNPPHAAHQLVALYVLETQPVDEVWFVPTFAHPFHKQLEPYAHRVAMCELMAAPLGARARVSRAEEELARRPAFTASRTIDLVEYVAGQGHELRWVIGADILADTPKWHRWDDVVARAPLIVVGRPGYTDPGAAITMPDISATHVREVLAQNGDAANLVPREVLRYIARNHLYHR